MKYLKDFSRFRAEKLTYVIFSRFDELYIQQQPADTSFDYIIDVTDEGHQTGRLFGVEIKATENETPMDIFAKIDFDKYRKIMLPLILVIVNTINDKSFYTWIIKPTEEGRLTKFDKNKSELFELNNDNVKIIIRNITNWYEKRLIPVT